MPDAANPGPADQQTPAHRLAEVFSASWARARERMRSDEHAARHGAVDAHLDQWEEQSADTLRNAFKMFLDQESIPDEWRALFEDAIAPRHATGFFFALIEFIGAVFVAASALGAIPTRHLLNSAWTADPAMPISPADAADA